MPSRSSLMALLLAAVLITLLQLVLAALAIGPENLRDFLHSLGKWDGDWYISIARDGYHSVVPPVAQNWNISNVAFFPGFPLAVRLMHELTRLEYRIALVLVAHVFTAGFWAYFLLICRSWKISGPLIALAIFLILMYPGAYFLIVGQSESLFLFAVTGLIYWTNRPGRHAAILAALHGIAATGTRLVGIAAALYPVLRGGTARSRMRNAAVSAVSMLGTALFFLYCQLRFGAWDLYMQTERIGWGVTPKPLAVIDPSMYRLQGIPFWSGINLDAVGWNRFFIPVLIALFGIVVAIDAFARVRSLKSYGERTGLIPVGLMIIAVSLSRPESFMRFGLPPFVLLVLAATHLLSQTERKAWKVLLFVPLGAASVILLMLQLTMTYRFAHDLWI